LYGLGDSTLPVHHVEGSVEILRFSRPVANFLERALAFGAHLRRVLEVAPELSIAHFRDPWSGVPVLARPRKYAAVYEVNALPSIELPHAFGGLAARTLEKIHADERLCLDRCDAIVTPSQTTRALLEKLGVAPAKIDRSMHRRATSSTSVRCRVGRASTHCFARLPGSPISS
jgi:hypothetical protein